MKKTNRLNIKADSSQIDILSNEDAGIVFKAILRYAQDGQTTEISSPIANFAFLMFKNQMDEEAAKRNEISQKRAAAVNERWERGRVIQTDTNEYKPIQTDTKNTNVSPPVKKPKPDKEAIRIRQEKAKNEFLETLRPYLDLYGRDMLNDFFRYWTEPNKSGTQWKFQMEKTWDLSRRLSTWSRNNFNRYSNGTVNSTNSQQSRNQRAADAASIIARLAAEDDGCQG